MADHVRYVSNHCAIVCPEVAILVVATRLYKQYQAAEQTHANRMRANLKNAKKARSSGHDPYGVAEIVLREVNAPSEASYKLFHRLKLAQQRVLARTAVRLPVWAWMKDQGGGVSPNGLGLIVGETDDLNNYRTDGCVYKRMGLAVTREGQAQRRARGKLGREMGFSPRRRAAMHMVGVGLVNCNKGKYRRLYEAQKVTQLARGLTPKHADKRARRYIEKRFLRDLRHAWRRMTIAPVAEVPSVQVSSVVTSAA